MAWRRGTGGKWHLCEYRMPATLVGLQEQVTECGIDSAGMWLNMDRANKDSACKKCWKAHIKALNTDEKT